MAKFPGCCWRTHDAAAAAADDDDDVKRAQLG